MKLELIIEQFSEKKDVILDLVLYEKLTRPDWKYLLSGFIRAQCTRYYSQRRKVI